MTHLLPLLVLVTASACVAADPATTALAFVQLGLGNGELELSLRSLLGLLLERRQRE